MDREAGEGKEVQCEGLGYYTQLFPHILIINDKREMGALRPFKRRLLVGIMAIIDLMERRGCIYVVFSGATFAVLSFNVNVQVWVALVDFFFFAEGGPSSPADDPTSKRL